MKSDQDTPTTVELQSTVSSGVNDGFWENAQGHMVPVDRIKDIDRLRDEVVKELCQQAKVIAKLLADFRFKAMAEVEAFVTTSHEQYGKTLGGKKGNITLTSFDGRMQVVRQIQETLVFDERLQVAKELIDSFLHEQLDGAKSDIRALVFHAFQVDKEGKVSTSRVLGLRSLKIEHPVWLQAMEAISDSIRTASSKPYIRFYERNAAGKHIAISLDIAGM